MLEGGKEGGKGEGRKEMGVLAGAEPRRKGRGGERWRERLS